MILSWAAITPVDLAILSQSYRNHPDIIAPGSAHHYDDALRSHPSNPYQHDTQISDAVDAALTATVPRFPSGKRHVFVNVDRRQRSVVGTPSSYNAAEIRATPDMASGMLATKDIVPEDVLFLIPYRGQLNDFQSEAKIRLGSDKARRLRCSTIDSFACGESDIVFISMVMTDPDKERATYSFIANNKRMYQARFRPRQKLIWFDNHSMWRTRFPARDTTQRGVFAASLMHFMSWVERKNELVTYVLSGYELSFRNPFVRDMEQGLTA